ncbi:17236_t:CDS:2 [Acaulospora colombiana]|uniref:17236_t:CDS:1 n=1 Tax=Acaulospora colombiana TaxID=27376 RepID=A0ACA9LSJ0_9GLOM|nr:17236_t:CDS:2 [Acaulospora colombiana]
MQIEKSEKVGKGTFAQAGDSESAKNYDINGNVVGNMGTIKIDFFQSPSERQSSYRFKKLRKSDEQDISNEKDDEIWSSDYSY